MDGKPEANYRELLMQAQDHFQTAKARMIKAQEKMREAMPGVGADLGPEAACRLQAGIAGLGEVIVAADRWHADAQEGLCAYEAELAADMVRRR